ncbi:uncharacterized protein LOC100892744 isoform X2 [Strongylocentrotus purpuratus]|nr:uncharacterized protein LOC100892744 isoform X2 [Strongylocentrotus purpuratus]
MMSKRREYKNVMQKVVGRQGSTKGGRSSSPDRKQRQRQMLQEIRQNISEVRFETGEAIGAMGTDMNRMGKRLSRSSTTEADDEPNLPGDYGATDTLRMMKQLIIDQRDKEERESTAKAACSTPKPPADKVAKCRPASTTTTAEIAPCTSRTSNVVAADSDDIVVEER